MEIDQSYYILSNEDKTFLVIRDLKMKQADIEIKDKKDNFTLVFDFENLDKRLIPKKVAEFMDKDNIPQNIIIKNCLVEKPSDFFENLTLNLNLLFISDELYSMSPDLKILFPNVKTKKLVLKNMKINSQFQLEKFLDFIDNTGCEELILEDIFIELLIKKDEKDEKYNELKQYIGFENGKFYIYKEDKEKETKIKKIKMVDCPLFAITDDTFKDIKNYKDIAIDIDENSLLNPNVITKFKINNGYSDICFDLDSYKINEDDSKDNIEYIEYIFNLIIDDNNHEFEKLHFKNFDISKYEYITGENLSFIDEKNWVFSKEENERKKIFEDKTEKINKKIDDNLDKLSNIKELIFNNCSNYFINFIFKFINHSNKLSEGSNADLNYLKIKKCGKDYFNLENILSLHINNLVLFDTPLTIDTIPIKNKKGKIDNLTIKISSLEHYCKSNNLNYYRTIEIIVELINNNNFNQNLCFEMNALPSIMTFLAARVYNRNLKEKDKYKIPSNFYFAPNIDDDDEQKTKQEKIKRGQQKRVELIQNSFVLNNLKNKKILLKKNNIKNILENYEYFYSIVPKFERGRSSKKEFGKDIFNIDIDYKLFFQVNCINDIEFNNCLFTSYSNSKVEPKLVTETIANLIRQTKKNYAFDMKSLNEILFKNKSAEDLTFLFKYFSLNDGQQISSDIIEYLNNLLKVLDNLKYIFDRLRNYANETTIVFKNIKEKKEFFCILCILEIIINPNNYTNIAFYYHNQQRKYKLPLKEVLKKKLGPYFLKKKDENNKEVCSTVINYYYTSKEEEEIFGDYKSKKKIKFGPFTFIIEYQFDDQWEIIMK